MTLTCKVCNQDKLDNDFYTGRKECKSCTMKRRTQLLQMRYDPSNIDENDVIKCRNCKQKKPRGMFEFRKRSCKECSSIPKNERRQIRYHEIKDNDNKPSKTCVMCLKEKSGEDFYPKRDTCRACLSFQYQLGKVNRDMTGSKVCSKCDIEKPFTDFWYKRHMCKICDRAYHIQWCNENPERLCYHLKKYREKPSSLEKRRLYRVEYFQNDPYQKVVEAYRSRTRGLLQLKKCRTTDENSISWLGCSVDFFLKWIEYNFTDEMTWNNHGSYWHLDHIRPCASFDISNVEHRKQCFNWKNLAPLEARENMKKNCKIDNKIILMYEYRAEQFLAENNETDVHSSGASSTKD